MKEGVNINSNNISQILYITDKNSTITDIKKAQYFHTQIEYHRQHPPSEFP